MLPRRRRPALHGWGAGPRKTAELRGQRLCRRRFVPDTRRRLGPLVGRRTRRRPHQLPRRDTGCHPPGGPPGRHRGPARRARPTDSGRGPDRPRFGHWSLHRSGPGRPVPTGTTRTTSTNQHDQHDQHDADRTSSTTSVPPTTAPSRSRAKGSCAWPWRRPPPRGERASRARPWSTPP